LTAARAVRRSAALGIDDGNTDFDTERDRNPSERFNRWIRVPAHPKPLGSPVDPGQASSPPPRLSVQSVLHELPAEGGRWSVQIVGVAVISSSSLPLPEISAQRRKGRSSGRPSSDAAAT
jgi:hypothetical protein